MKTSLKLISTLAAIAAGASAFAQSQAGAVAAGFIGQRFFEARMSYLNANQSQSNAYGSDLEVNLPVCSFLDTSARYSYGWRESNSRIDDNILALSSTWYFPNKTFRPFIKPTLAYVDSNHAASSDDKLQWKLEPGIEVIVTENVALDLSAGYSGSFKNPQGGPWDGMVNAIFKINDRLSAIGRIRVYSGGDVSYGIGLAAKF
jgi:hypothetical protein